MTSGDINVQADANDATDVGAQAQVGNPVNVGYEASVLLQFQAFQQQEAHQ